MPLEKQLDQIQIPKDANVLAICLMGRNRSPKLVEVLQEHGYKNVTKLGMWEAMMPQKRRQIIGEVQYLVTLDPMAAQELREKYELTAGQVLIEFDVPEYIRGEDERRTLKMPEEIYEDIRQQIAPYLSD